jgi:hypothetical protein
MIDDVQAGPRPETKPPPARPHPTRWRWWPAAAVLAAGIALATVVSPAVRYQWALSLVRQPTRYTVLAFSDPSSLPATAVRGRPVPVSFTIGDDEGSLVSYRYVLASGSGTSLRTLSASGILVPSGATRTVTTSVVPQCAQPACRIQVSLPGQGEAIDFIVTLVPEPARRRR